MRKAKWLTWIVLCGAVFLLSGCLGPATLHEADGGRTVTLNVGDPLIVELRGNASTGFAWERVGHLAESILQPIEEASFRPDAEMPGSPGTFTFHYLAAATGTTRLDLVYKRPWEEEILDTFSVFVDVR